MPRSVFLLSFLVGCLPDFAVTTEVTDGFDFDNDGVAAPEDCDDTDPTLYPGAGEICDGVRTDCDTTVEQFQTSEVDLDGDGYVACAQWEGDSDQPSGDCAANDPDRNPGEDETIGDGFDSDCDEREICYLDEDGDGFRNSLLTELAEDVDCSAAGHALSTAELDCDDGEIDFHVGADVYVDCDEDTYYSGDAVASCDVADGLVCAELSDPDHSVEDPGSDADCDDEDPDLNPGAVVYVDCDEDTYFSGDPVASCDVYDGLACAELPDPPSTVDHPASDADCDDHDPDLKPGADVYLDCDDDGAFALESHDACDWPAGLLCEGWADPDWRPRINQAPIDCDDEDAKVADDVFVDCDGDNWYKKRIDTECEEQTCKDPSADPKSTWSKPDQVDDCNDNDPEEHYGALWYPDGDGDEYGDQHAEAAECERNAETDVADNTDCDDDNDDVGPLGYDWFPDCDGDGHASDQDQRTQCEEPTGEPVCDGNEPEGGWIADPEPEDVDECDENPSVPTFEVYYADCDEDGFADEDNFLEGCFTPSNDAECNGEAAPNWVAASTLTQDDEFDCDDTDGVEFPGQVWYLDCDHDGHITMGPAIDRCLRPNQPGDEHYCGSDYSETFSNAPGYDCDDADDQVHTGDLRWVDCDDDDLYRENQGNVCDTDPQCPYTELAPTTYDCDDDDNPDPDASQPAGSGWYYPDCDNDGQYAMTPDWVCNPTAPGDWQSCEGQVPAASDTVAGADCADTDPNQFEGQLWWPDCDGDGRPAEGAGTYQQCATPSDNPCQGDPQWLHDDEYAADCDDSLPDVIACGMPSGDFDVTTALAYPSWYELFVVTAENLPDGLPSALAVAPDLDGDGYLDLLVGMAGLDGDDLDADEGLGAVVGGAERDALARDENLDLLEGILRSRFQPGPEGFEVGASAAGEDLLAGPDPSNPVSDVAYGAPGTTYADPTVGTTGGAVFLLAGDHFDGGVTDPYLSLFATADSDGSTNDAGADARFGASLAVGDVDADGPPDLLVGAPGANRVYLFFGPLDEHAGLADENGHQVLQDVYADLVVRSGGGAAFGTALALADFDGDGNDDLVVTDPDYDMGVEGDVGLVGVLPYADLSAAGAFGSMVDALQLSGMFGVHGASDEDEVGASLATAHADSDVDGYADLLFGDPGTNGGAGAAYFVLGLDYHTDPGPDWRTAGVDDLSFTAGGSGLGTSVTFVDDTNSDGITEVAIGQDGSGDSVVFLVQPASYTTSYVIDLDSDDSGEVLARIRGETDSGFGTVLAAGDLDDDGLSDLIIGAPQHGGYGAVFGLFGGD